MTMELTLLAFVPPFAVVTPRCSPSDPQSKSAYKHAHVTIRLEVHVAPFRVDR